MKLGPGVWNQVRNLTADTLCAAPEKDGWAWEAGPGAAYVYRHYDSRRVAIHYHPGKTFGPNLLKSLLADIGWSEEEMKRLRLIK